MCLLLPLCVIMLLNIQKVYNLPCKKKQTMKTCTALALFMQDTVLNFTGINRV